MRTVLAAPLRFIAAVARLVTGVFSAAVFAVRLLATIILVVLYCAIVGTVAVLALDVVVGLAGGGDPSVLAKAVVALVIIVGLPGCDYRGAWDPIGSGRKDDAGFAHYLFASTPLGRR